MKRFLFSSALAALANIFGTGAEAFAISRDAGPPVRGSVGVQSRFKSKKARCSVARNRRQAAKRRAVVRARKLGHA